jgi:hypothetical protein
MRPLALLLALLVLAGTCQAGTTLPYSYYHYVPPMVSKRDILYIKTFEPSQIEMILNHTPLTGRKTGATTFSDYQGFSCYLRLGAAPKGRLVGRFTRVVTREILYPGAPEGLYKFIVRDEFRGHASSRSILRSKGRNFSFSSGQVITPDLY